jgi:GR25 family glycosyltransferase involved in LPS biosynthesis
MLHPFNRCFDRVLVLTTNHKISEERRKRIIPRLEGIDYTFFYGCHYDELNINEYYANGCYYELTPGQIACTESFRKIYKFIFDNNISNCLILEDDIIIDNNITLLKDIYSQLPKDWQLFYLGYGHHDPIPLANYSKNLFRIDRNSNYFPDATIAFAVTKEYAKKLFDINSKITWTADGNIQNLLKTTDCVGYASVPKLVHHEAKDSVIENFIK